MHYDRLTKNRLYILTANDEIQKRGDAVFPFSQEANFYWLTNIVAPQWLVVINTATDERVLVAPAVDATKQLFDGVMTHEEAVRISGATRVIVASELEVYLEALSKEFAEVHTLGRDPIAKHYPGVVLNPAPARLRKVLKGHFAEVRDCRKELSRLRAIKTAEEVERIKEAVRISTEGFSQVEQGLSSFTYEYSVAAQIEFVFKNNADSGVAYETIVASGKNACTLHYTDTSAPLERGQLVLIDAGASYKEYASDITRTYAVGAPTERQRAVHAAVQEAHNAIVGLIKPGVSFESYQKKTDEIMKRALEGLGLLKKPSDYRKYFPHAISHGIGIDVHESLGGFSEFMAGMVLTVEPGVYIPDEAIGVRIEDTILVTDDGIENLSAALPTDL